MHKLIILLVLTSVIFIACGPNVELVDSVVTEGIEYGAPDTLVEIKSGQRPAGDQAPFYVYAQSIGKKNRDEWDKPIFTFFDHNADNKFSTREDFVRLILNNTNYRYYGDGTILKYDTEWRVFNSDHPLHVAARKKVKEVGKKKIKYFLSI